MTQRVQRTSLKVAREAIFIRVLIKEINCLLNYPYTEASA